MISKIYKGATAATTEIFRQGEFKKFEFNERGGGYKGQSYFLGGFLIIVKTFALKYNLQ